MVKVYKSWIFDHRGGVNWNEPTKYFFNKEQAEQDNKTRVAKLEEEHPNGWYHYGVSEIEVF